MNTIAIIRRAINPSAVSGRVRAVVVDAVNRVTSRTWPHVSKKGRKVIGPFRAHGYSASTVARIARVVGIRAAFLGATPRGVLTALAFVSVVAVLKMALAAEASTAIRLTAPQDFAAHNFVRAAVAVTHPHRGVSLSPDVLNRCQQPEALKRDVDEVAGVHLLILSPMRTGKDV